METPFGALNSQLGEFSKTTVGVHQGCLLSPILFNFFLEKIMQETLHDHHTSISIGVRSLCNLQFADDIDFMGGRMMNFTTSPTIFVDRATAYGIELSTEKRKSMTNIMITYNISADISMNGHKVGEMTSFLSHSCAKMAPAQQKSASGLPQQWQQWPE